MLISPFESVRYLLRSAWDLAFPPHLPKVGYCRHRERAFFRAEPFFAGDVPAAQQAPSRFRQRRILPCSRDLGARVPERERRRSRHGASFVSFVAASRHQPQLA